jgi:hypothetical protein
MNEPESPRERPKAEPLGQRRTAQIIRLDERLMANVQPDELSPADALKIVRALASDTDNIVLIPYGKRRTTQRKIERRPIERCVQRGTIIEGPFLNQHGNWQMNMYRHAAGEELTCR